MTQDTSGPATDTGASPFEPVRHSRFGQVIRWTLIGAAVLAATGAAWWFTRKASPTAAAGGHEHGATATAEAARQPVMLSAEAANRIGVTYAPVEIAPLGGEVRAVGLVAYDETRVKTIAPKIDGYVEQLFVAFTGESVEVGAPLLRIYSPMLVTAQEELLLAKKFVTDVGLAGGAGGDAARDAEALLVSARRRLKNWDIPDEDIARVERTGEVTKTLTLRSPVSGTVVQKNVLGGQRIMAGDAVYQVAELRELWVEGEVFEQDLPTVRLGQHVLVEVAGAARQARSGSIVFISPTISPDTRTAKIRVVLPNADLALKPGMYATIRIQGTARNGVLQVPRSALLVTGERTLVFVRGADGMLTAREVELGQAAGERVEVRRGLNAGETVVASATFLVDAESNLGSALGGMGNMPGMDMSPAKKATPATDAKDLDMPGMDMSSPTLKAPATVKTPAKAPPKAPAKAPAKKADPMANMPGMDHTTHKP